MGQDTVLPELSDVLAWKGSALRTEDVVDRVGKGLTLVAATVTQVSYREATSDLSIHE